MNQSFNVGLSFYLIVGVAGVVALALGVLLYFLLSGRPKKENPEGGLEENLAEYPPPPVVPGTRKLTVKSLPTRLRLVVIAPVGKTQAPNANQAEALLDRVLHGLGDVAKADKPRIVVWPAQLSNVGFAPTFFRLVQRPEPEHEASRWVLVAGPATAAGQKILLGLALWADEATDLGHIKLEPHEWNEVLDLE